MNSSIFFSPGVMHFVSEHCTLSVYRVCVYAMAMCKFYASTFRAKYSLKGVSLYSNIFNLRVSGLVGSAA